MGQVLSSAIVLARQRPVRLLVALLALGGSALVPLPLFGVPGYELGLALSLGVGLLGGGVGLAAAFQVRRRLLALPPEAPLDSPLRASWRALGPALLLNGAVLVPPFASATLFSLLGTRCDPFALAAFYPLLTLPSAALAACAGVFCGFLAHRPGRAVLLYALLVLASGVATAWPLVFGPQVFASNHFLGYLPGPLYDEALSVTPGLLWFRLETLLLCLLLWAATALTLDVREARLRRPRPTPGLLTVLALAAVALLALEWQAPAFGLRMTDAWLAQRLGGSRDSEHFHLVYPRGMPRDDVERMVRDLEFRHAQLSRFLGGAPEGPLHIWLYRSEEEKRELVGAGRTQFAKPWRQELHIQLRAFPHSTLKHELAHVMAAPAGGGPFRVTTRLGLWPLMGIIEGLAVAADDAVQGELTLHEWAAGMRRKGLAPNVRVLVGPEGFYKSAPARAYTLVGSFLRYLADTHGPAQLRALYAHGDFEAAYGRPLDALATEWEDFLDALPLDEAAASRAFLRFRSGSLFSRTCAREVALLGEEAGGWLESDPEQALTLYQRAALLQPHEPHWPLGEATALQRLERPEEASRVLAALASRVQGQGALEAQVALAQGALATEQGLEEEARDHLQRALSLAPSPEVTRTAQVRLAALGSSARSAPIQAYFRDTSEELRLLRLATALESAPEDAWLHYLLGRRLHQVGAPTLAASHLAKALAGELPEAVRRESLRLRVEAAYLAGDCGAVRQEIDALPDFGPAFRAVANEWGERCTFEQAVFRGPLVPRDAFR